jgi:ribose transport system permease protein
VTTLSPTRRPAPLRIVSRIHPAYVALAILLVILAAYNPNFLTTRGIMNFLQRSASLCVVSIGQMFVLVTGGFDLSQGSLITLTVMGSALMINNDPALTWSTIAVVYAIGIASGLFNGLVVSFLKVPSIIVTLGALLSLKGVALAWSGGSPQGYLPYNFRQFGRVTLRDVPLIEVLPIAVIALAAVIAICGWLLHGTTFGRLALIVGDNPRAAELAGVRVRLVRIVAFLVSAMTAVTAGILLGGFAGPAQDVGDGYELQAIAANVLGGTQLLGGRGSVAGVVAGSLTLTALFTVLNLIGLPKPLRDAVQGGVLVAAVAYSVRRQTNG